MRVQLARMEGKLDLSNLRHEQTDAWKITVDQRLHRHGNDISVLQAANTLRDGQRQGFTLAVKAGWVLGGSGIMGMIALIARHFAL